MKVNMLVIGQGICGTFLSHYLEKAGLSFLVIDDARPQSASRTAAGVINPVTGRRLVKTWMIEELMDFARKAYEEIGIKLGIQCLTETSIVDFFPTPRMRLTFLERQKEESTFLAMPVDEKDHLQNFHYEFGYGLIKPALLIDLSSLLNAFRKKLSAAGQLMESIFEINALKLSENGIKYQDIDAEWIIFCDGTTSFTNPEFRNLPFAPNKGEVLIIETEGIPMTKTIYKKGISLVPLENNLFWVGSSYDWEFKNEAPDRIFRERTELLLLDWLKRPFTILDHRAAVRPATLERRPFVGFHPLYEHVGILNGMGTKGCSLAPYFSNQLVENIVTQKPVLPEADIRRFSKILSRP